MDLEKASNTTNRLRKLQVGHTKALGVKMQEVTGYDNRNVRDLLEYN